MHYANNIVIESKIRNLSNRVINGYDVLCQFCLEDYNRRINSQQYFFMYHNKELFALCNTCGNLYITSWIYKNMGKEISRKQYDTYQVFK